MKRCSSMLVLTLAPALALSALQPAPSEAKSCPLTKIVVAYPPGAPDDLVARLLAQGLGKFGGTYIVENQAGASGRIGNAAVARASADGCTLLVVNQNLVVQPAAKAKIPYEVPGSFAPVAFLAVAPETISVNPSVPAKTMQELIALMKANPGKYSYASPGYGSSPHIAAERLFRLTYGLEVVHVPFQGGPPAVASTVSGHTQIVHLTLPVVGPVVQDKQLRMLAVADKKRHPLFPDVPTLEEAGIPNHDVGFWNALLAPKGTPDEVLTDIHRKTTQVMMSAHVREKLEPFGFLPVTGSREQLATHIETDLGRWREIVNQADIAIE